MAPCEENWLLVALIAVAILAIATSSQDVESQACPDECSCPNTPPALGLVCNDRNLTAIPAINTSVHFVDFSGNPLKALTNQTLAPIRNAHSNLETLVLKACQICSIDADSFDNLQNLRVIDLSSNGISILAPGVFIQLEHLSEINLSENNITSVSSQWFSKSTPLRVLNLTANPIQQLEVASFKRLTSLEELRLDQCALHLIDPHAFDGLFKLHTLNLSHNRLTTLTPDSITWLRELHTLELHANPWECNCDLQTVTLVLLIRGFHTLASNLTCTHGSQQLIQWTDVNTTLPDCESQLQMHARQTTYVGNSAQHRRKAAQPQATNTSRLATPSALFSSHIAAARSTYSSVATIGLWCAGFALVAVTSYLGVYLTSKMCVYATTKVASAAKQVTASASCKKPIVRRQSSDCEQALVDETTQFRDHFYLVDEASSDVNISIDV